MSYIAYPKLCVSADGYNENPERGSTLHRAEDGTPWIVNLWPETRYTFEIVHPALSAEEQLELEQFYDQHIGDEVGWDNPRRQERWIVRMVGPPRLTGMRSGLRGDVEMTLVGYRGTAPTYSVPPVVSGLHQIGQVISVSQGTWQSEYPMQFEYQWLRNGEPIAGATGQNYTLVDDDLFDMISVRVTASSLGGSTSVETDPVLARLDSAVSWLYSDMAETIFVDVDGNTPATWGDPVGLVKDSSGNGNDFTQPTVTARPILGRVPRGGRRNLLTWTEDLTPGAWGDADTTATQSVQSPDGAADAWELEVNLTKPNVRIYQSFSSGSREFTVSVAVKKTLPNGGSVTVAIRHSDGLARQIFNISTTGVVTVGSVQTGHAWITGATSEYIAGSDGWYNVTVSFEFDTVDPNPRFEIEPDGRDAIAGNGVSVWHPQVETGSTATPYQRVTTPYDITEAGVPDVYYLSFDLTDDNLTTTLPAIENGTVVIAGTNGIWIDDDYNFAGGTFSIGPTTYTGGPEGILTAIGEPIVGGFLVINRQLSQLEREQIIQEMKGRGAPGVFEWGPELADPSAWSVRPYNLITWLPDGRAEFTANGTTAFRAGQFLDLIPGRWYTFTVDVEAVTHDTAVRSFGPTWSTTTGQRFVDIPQGERRNITITFQAREGEKILGAEGPFELDAKFILGDITVRQLELIP